jgi:hypothetical protein
VQYLLVQPVEMAEGSVCKELAGVPSEQVPTALHSYFSSVACSLLRGQEELNSPPKEQTVVQILSNPLQWMLFGGDPSIVLATFEDQGSTSNFCGKVFKSGEPAYFCK